MFCPKCGTENEDEDVFCRKCGAELHLREFSESNSINKINQRIPKEPKQSKFKENKILIIAIIAIIIVAGCIGSYLLMQPHYKEINVVGVTMEVPDSDANVSITSESINEYNDTKNKVFVYGYDSTNSSPLVEAMAFELVKNVTSNDTRSINVNGFIINEKTNGALGYYIYLGHKLIVIISNDKNTMTHIIKSLKEKSEPNNSSNSANLTSNLTIQGGEISTGSSLSDKTKAHIYVGKEHSGETIKITVLYSRDGTSLNNGDILTKTVNSKGYVSVNSAEAFSKYPDTAVINIYDNGNIINTKTVTLNPTSGTQSF